MSSSPSTSVSANGLSGSGQAGSAGFIIKARIPLRVPGDVVEGFGSVWVRSWNRRGLLSRIDPATEQIVARIDVGRPRSVPALAAGDEAIWLLDTDGILVRVDPASNQVVARIPVAPSATYLAVGRKAVWVTCCGPQTASGPGALYRIDPETNRVVSRTELGGSPGRVAAGAGGVWVINYQGGVWHIDPESGRVLSSIRLGYPSLTDVVANRRWVFVTVRSGLHGSGGIVRIDPQTNAIASRIALPGALMGVTAAANKIWVNSGPLVVVASSADRVIATVPVFPPTDSNAGIAVAGSSTWIADPVHQQLIRLDSR